MTEAATIIALTAAMWGSAFLCWRRYNKTEEWKWAGGTIACLLVGIAINQALPATRALYAEASCSIDWDGRSNPTVCD